DCATYKDFREVLTRDDIDSVSLGLPDHWHAIPAIMAAKSGKDVFGEKPLAHSIREGRAMVDAVERYGRIWQTGSWQRSQAHFRHACEIVRSGRIGKVLRVEVGLPSGHADFAGTAGQDDIVAPPPELDYDMWVGPAPWKPYVKSRSHKNWRWDLDIGGGQILDWVGHHVDIAHWGLGFDYDGPVEIEGFGEYPADGVYNTATKYWVNTRYKDGTELIMAGGYPGIRGGTKWIGEYGWGWGNRGSSLETFPS
ncbi:MAG: Gfo/Idh/MocA family oxidoreductase, partial [Hyphomicrobiales bacterium]|nr:Gfo/Idh/MocA family oxidoreductase [Hyphomicrobiales bacterium]